MQREKWKWYLSIKAVEQYMQVMGLTGELEDDNPDFIRAQEALGELSVTARLVPGANTIKDAELYRANVVIRGRKERLELTVTNAPREEGNLPQLVRVRKK